MNDDVIPLDEYFSQYARNNYRKKCGLPPLKNEI